MSSTREERVENALQQLLERIVPQYDDEDEDSADQRWDEANKIARARIAARQQPNISEDIAHAADLIKNKLIRDNGNPQAATRFSNLYSRLLSQPVLNQKWAILYFLFKLSDQSDGVVNAPIHDSPPAHGRRSFDAPNDDYAAQGLRRMPEARHPDVPPAPPVINLERSVPPRRHTPMEEERPTSVAKTPGPQEPALLRDLPFTLQGLSSSTLILVDQYSLKLPSTLPVPLVSLLNSLAEPALLYASLADFVKSSEGGLVGQSLRSALDHELRSYLTLVATLEAQIRRALLQLEQEKSNGGLGHAGVTLKRCVVWTRDATLALRLMSRIVESARGLRGGEMISTVHSFSSSHGDPFVRNFAERLLSQVTRPFYSMLHAWIYDGELEDPYEEFFVIESPTYQESGATSVWQDKYKVLETMIPTIVTPEFAQRVFLIGKSLNFIRHGCGDSAWVEKYSKEATRDLKHGDFGLLANSIDEAYKAVMARLTSLMEHKFALFSHLQALKKYLLLGQGDFIALLMESLATNLDRPANSQYRHNLTAQLEHAIRNSNAQYESAEVLRRLDARMLELSHGEIGWDVFTLEYRIDSPLDVIITPWASKQYLKVFNFLWRVKRVEFALSVTWRRLQTGARGVLAAVSDKLGSNWKSARGKLAEMIHFVNQLQHYILFEVIETGWAGLQKAINNPDATLDTLIEAHNRYLSNITRKGLLGGGGINSGQDYTSQLHELLKIMLHYRDAVDGLYSYSVADFTRRQDRAAQIDARTKAGTWGVAAEGDDEMDIDPAPRPLLVGNGELLHTERTTLAAIQSRMESLESKFAERLPVLLGDLAYQPDSDMRFLGMVMNFNTIYKIPPKRKRTHGSKEKEKLREQAVPGATERTKA